MGALSLLFAVHISDGVLTLPWIVGGFLGASLLIAVAMVRVRDEEIPRIALLTAAFFVASLIHVRLGPTSVHLLLNGLVGVILGWRAGLAIPVGLALQAVLLGHGGFLTIGINSCILTLPALLAGFLFHLLYRLPSTRRGWCRSLLVGLSVLVWTLGLVFGVGLLLGNWKGHWSAPDTTLALHWASHPGTLLLGCVLAAIGVWGERRLLHAPEFALGLLVGLTAVLTTLVLLAAVLLWGGAENWHAVVVLVFVAHLPVAILEGIILGFTVGFLTRVKPELLLGWQSARQLWSGSERVTSDEAPEPAARHSEGIASAAPPDTCAVSRPSLRSTVPLLVLGALLLAASPAQAHRLEAEYRVLPEGRVQVESWFETGDSPRMARVQVFTSAGTLLTEGMLNDKGVFVFHFDAADDLKVVINAGAGHRKELLIGRQELGNGLPGKEAVPPVLKQPQVKSEEPFADRSSRVSPKDVLIGISFLLSLAGFVLSLRNGRQLRELRRALAADRQQTATVAEGTLATVPPEGNAHSEPEARFHETAPRR